MRARQHGLVSIKQRGTFLVKVLIGNHIVFNTVSFQPTQNVGIGIETP